MYMYTTMIVSVSSMSVIQCSTEALSAQRSVVCSLSQVGHSAQIHSMQAICHTFSLGWLGANAFVKHGCTHPSHDAAPVAEDLFI